ncbi:hypothetical protein DFR24_4058 [Panacagrimonas perspica]|uniref:Uncharacterized protein n=1 Tax=Panacagrimonas perspica TaxID=381431 RepID=A0A4S3K6J6_9GAMM|nr:hypothetical protein DFR24_4058 [Panacagrimonas perspica]THD03789.1 hypothetical protein B1810_07890 [Panacagrimonas perspica]
MRRQLRQECGFSSTRPEVGAEAGDGLADRVRDPAKLSDLDLREGDIGWILFSDALQSLVSGDRGITKAMQPEPVDHRATFDISWAFYRHNIGETFVLRPRRYGSI